MSPCGWPVRALGEVAVINPRRDGRLRTMADDLEVTFVPMASVDEITGSIAKPELRRLDQVRHGFTHFIENDVIFAKITPCMQNGKSAVARQLVNGLGFGSTEFHIIRSKEAVFPEWIWHFVRQPTLRREAQRHFRGSAGQQRVPADFLAQCKIPMPGLSEQQRVLGRLRELLKRVDEVYRLRSAAVAEAKILESAMFRDFFMYGDTCQQWPTVPLGDLTRSSKYGTSKKADVENRGVPVLRMGNIVNGYLDCTHLKYVQLSESDIVKYSLEPGDILINRTNSLELVGKAATFWRSDGPWVYASYLVRVRVDRTRVLPEYVTGVINSRIEREYVRRRARRAIGMVNINAKEMAGVPIPLPPIATQQLFVEQLGQVRAAAQEIQTSITGSDAEMLRSAILWRAFAGEL